MKTTAKAEESNMSTGLYNLYKQGGQKFLAYRLARLLRPVETEADRILHNDILVEVLQLINEQQAPQGQVTPNEKELLDWMANVLLPDRIAKGRRFKKFLSRMAGKVMLLAGRKKG